MVRCRVPFLEKRADPPLTFRLISPVLSDIYPYSNRREWRHQLESLAAAEVDIIAVMFSVVLSNLRPYSSRPPQSPPLSSIFVKNSHHRPSNQLQSSSIGL
ncbi:mannose-1-phosphate guanyltransferase [Striga asiatica]|uniref:Mannose-1-phosphate guanyltransferase n=1 Tax=Striga asiatica TaxID=4170 RepID=A0A5A7PW67_STRAF|nr:mannose-1-phosphate guanyltransferase [Striga asiatica]